MDRTTNSTTPRRIHMDFDHAAQWPFRILVTDSDTGEGIAHACTFVDGSRLFDEALNYALMLDVAMGDPPIDEPPPVPPGQGGDDPERGPYSDEYLAEVDHLCRCADGEHILDWAMVDALEAHVRRALRDLAAAPDSPAPSFHQPAPAGGDAASAAGLYLARCYAWQQRAAALGLTHGRAA